MLKILKKMSGINAPDPRAVDPEPVLHGSSLWPLGRG